MYIMTTNTTHFMRAVQNRKNSYLEFSCHKLSDIPGSFYNVTGCVEVWKETGRTLAIIESVLSISRDGPDAP